MSNSILENYEIEHYNIVRKIAPECMVLLKSDGSFPVASNSKIALFGAGARHTYRGGTGGGIVEVRSFTTVEQGLKNAGFNIVSDKWLESYDDMIKKAKEAHKNMVKSSLATEGLTGLGALSMPIKLSEYSFDLKFDTDICIYVLSRVSGEGADREERKGDTRLSDEEICDIKKCCELYKKFMLVLNVGGIVDLSPVVDTVPNILLLSQTGIAIGDSFADVLCGRAYPSGKLSDTWAAMEDYQHIGDWVESDDTCYKEGIYVGYRYFDAVGKTPVYPFGYGLSYTKFDTTCVKVTLEGSTLRMSTAVKNVGSFAGKEVVQAYASFPDDNSDYPINVLCAFAKTDELDIGKQQTLELSFDFEQLAVFDEKLCANILPSGKYIISLGNSSRDLVPVCVVELDKLAVVQKLSHVGGNCDFKDFIPKKRIRRIPDVMTFKLSHSVIKEKHNKYIEPSEKAKAFVSTLSDEQVLKFLTGGFEEKVFFDRKKYTAGQVGQTAYDFEEKGVPSVSMADGPAGLHISGDCGIDEKGIYPKVSDETKAVKELLPPEIYKYLLTIFPTAANDTREGECFTQYCTAVPIETAIAQSFNTDVAVACGKIFLTEMQNFNIDCHLAPALNIHRHPLCGRNFEYFSEDPFLSGVMAAAIVNTVQSDTHLASCLKHFICNEQDTNRLNSNSHVSERALRDIYMKPFEIAISLSHPKAVMTSYNLVNGIHTSESKDLIETTLRGEFGFDGVVMSDWVSYPDSLREGFKYPRTRPGKVIAAGNDLMMPGQEGHYKELIKSLQDGLFTIKWARQCAARVVDFAYRTKGEK